MLKICRSVQLEKFLYFGCRATSKCLPKASFHSVAVRFATSPRWSSTLRSKTQRALFHTTSLNKAPPLIAVLLKTGGVKVLKALTIIFGRSFRKLYSRLPESVQSRVGKHKIFFSVVGLSAPFVGYYSYTHYEACPITGRKRWITFTRDQVVALSDLDYQQLLGEYEGKLLSESHPIYIKNKAIVSQLVDGNCDIDIVKNTEWSLHVIDDPTITNAFVLPNGHIFVFTGMLKMLNTWEEMAVILGHEMSHAILGHSQEQQSYLAFGELLTIPLLAFIWFMLEDFTAFLIYTIQHHIYPIIYEYGFNLPYNRLLEAEADEVGLMLSSKACYDPRWSVLLWEKMAMKEALEGNSNADEYDFLSTHPNSQKRAILLEQKLSEALEMRKKCNCPPLPTDVDPQAAAHQMRKCVQIIKEKKVLMEKLDQKTSLLESGEYIKPGKDSVQDGGALQRIREESEELKLKLRKLDTEYVQLASAPKLKSRKPQSQEESKEEKAGLFADIWYKLTGKVATTGKLTDTLFEKENKLLTVSLQKSAFRQQNS